MSFKKIILVVVFIAPFLCIGQTTTENYIQKTSYKVQVQDGGQSTVNLNDRLEGITYFDGLGRPIQTISVQGGGSKENIVQYFEYDLSGIQTKQYLPWVTGTELSEATTMDFIDPLTLKGDVFSFYDTTKYGDTPNPYSESIVENSPLNRVLETGAPGLDWLADPLSDSDHTIKFEYGSNIASEVSIYSVSLDASYNPTLVDGSTYYNANELYKSVIKDENWKASDGDNKTTQEFKNKLGQFVLKRTFDNATAHDTYYVYDNYGNLTYVIPPLVDKTTGISTTELDDICYQYKYDHRNRLVEKKIPGKGWEYIVYDDLDRPILTQDALLRANGQWLFTKYDKFGRVAYTGIYSRSTTRSTIESEVSSSSILYETQQPIPISISTTSIYYTKNSYPTTNIDVLTINYYDTYVDIPTAYINVPTVPIYGANITSNTKGLPTVGKVRVLETDDWITTLTSYDDKARPIYSASYNAYLDTTDELKTNLDFIGILLQSESYYKKGTDNPIISKDYFTYDHQNRLLTQLQDVDNNGLELIAENTYDELGQLTKKRVGGQLFKSGYTDLVNVDVTPEGIIQKTSTSNNWNAGIATIGKMTDDGGVSFTVVNEGDKMIIGLNDVNSGNGFVEIDYAFQFLIDNATGGPIFQVRIDSSPLNPTITPYIAGDTFEIERKGTSLEFIHNGNLIYTHVITGTNPPLLADASFRSPTSAIENLYFYATTIDKVLQEVDYTYNIRGWLKEINPIANLTDDKNTDLFSFKINYTTVEGDASIQTAGLYNGNIAQTIWQTANDDIKRGYGYSYDDLNRIKKAVYREGSDLNFVTGDYLYDIKNISYDNNGNILSLDRFGRNNPNNSNTFWDKLVYNYSANQLIGVIDNSASSAKDKGFNDTNNSDIDYTYDVNGNMITDDNKNIVSIEYNHLNLPRKIVFDNALFDPEVYPSNAKGIIYVYDATGIKLEKRVVEAAASVDTKTTYAGNFMYQDDALQFFNQPEGYTQPVFKLGFFSHYEYVYQYKDHLGNIRLSYSDNNRDGSVNVSEIIEESNYYPFGLKHKGYNNVISGGNDLAQNWKFNGKEQNLELGFNLYHYGARFYDPALGVFTTIDPKAEKFMSQGPYVYAVNNPIAFHEKNGEYPILGGLKKLLKKLSNIGIKKITQSLEKKTLKKSLKKSQKSLKKNVDDHLKKYDDFMKDPIGNSSDEAIKIMTKDNPSKKVLLDRAKGRGEALLKQVQKNQGELNKVNDKLKQLKKGSLATIAAASSSTNTSTSSSKVSGVISVAVENVKDAIPIMKSTKMIGNAGKNIFGDNSVGNFVDDWLNPFSIADDLNTMTIMGTISIQSDDED